MLKIYLITLCAIKFEKKKQQQQKNRIKIQSK
jgi:hypothetical protein